MCGRFTLRTPPAVLIKHFSLELGSKEQLQLFGPRYNIAPTQDILTVRVDGIDGRRHANWLRWGLIPAWSKDPKPAAGPPLINARSETLTEKPTFRAAFRQRRCLIPADGFYEWRKSGSSVRGKKSAFLIRRPDNRLFAFAGLWETWTQSRDLSGGDNRLTIESCTIVTTEANAKLRELHERMPVMLAPGDYDIWLDPKVDDPTMLQPLLTGCADDELVVEPVGTHVNRVANDDSRCTEVQRSLF